VEPDLSDLTNSSSKSILTDGVYTSSYCPFLTEKIKAIKKMRATRILKPSKR
jgi:hypothetical protein